MKFISLFPHRERFSSTELSEHITFCVEVIQDAERKALNHYKKKYDRERYVNLALFAHEQPAYICIQGLSAELVSAVKAVRNATTLYDFVKNIIDGDYLEGQPVKIPSIFLHALRGKLEKYFMPQGAKVYPV